MNNQDNKKNNTRLSIRGVAYQDLSVRREKMQRQVDLAIREQARLRGYQARDAAARAA